MSTWTRLSVGPLARFVVVSTGRLQPTLRALFNGIILQGGKIMRSMVLRGLMLSCALAIGYFTQAHSDEPTAAPAASTPPTQSTSPANDAATVPPSEAEEQKKREDAEFKRASKGYRKSEKDGQTLYCRSEKPLGTRISRPICLTEVQLRERLHNAESARDEMRRAGPDMCRPPKVC